MEQFFFVTTYDKISAEILASLINLHPDIHCNTEMPCSLIPEGEELNIDTFIETNTSKDKKFSGNVHNLTAFELQYKTITEKTAHPYRKANIVISPMARARFLIYSWLHSGKSIEEIYSDLMYKILYSKPFTSISRHRFSYFYNHILKSLLTSLSQMLEACKKNPEAAKKMPYIDVNSLHNQLFIIALTTILAFDSADLPIPSKTFRLEDLLTNANSFINFLNHLTNNKIQITDDFVRAYHLKLVDIARVFNDIESLPPWFEWQAQLFNAYLNAKLETIHFPHINKTVQELYQNAGYPADTSQKRIYSKLISIQLNSNRGAQLSAYFDNIEETADNPRDIEVIVNIDLGDKVMKALLDKEILTRKFTLKYIQTPAPKSFFDMWKPLNNILAVTDPNAYFLLNISDEMFFATKGWDTILKKYVGYFPDHYFRLRASRNKFRNYFDRWECNFIQDSIPITTKKWVDAGGNWNPCFGPDSFQQLVAFYLMKESQFTNENLLRDIPIVDIEFFGDVPAVGVSPDKHWKMQRESIRAMQKCQSYKMQLEAKRRAMIIKANIIAKSKNLLGCTINQNTWRKRIEIINDKKIIYKMSYKLSRISIFLTNQYRKLYFYNYFGTGFLAKPKLRNSFFAYLLNKHNFVLKTVIMFAVIKSKLTFKRKPATTILHNPTYKASEVKSNITGLNNNFAKTNKEHVSA